MDLSPITIAVPLLNEAPRLPALLDALAAQNYPRDLMQILLLDGGSEDGTVALARRAAAEHGPIQVLANPGRSAAAALNLALDYASGAYFANDQRKRHRRRTCSSLVAVLPPRTINR